MIEPQDHFGDEVAAWLVPKARHHRLRDIDAVFIPGPSLSATLSLSATRS
jgi:hypothetical protein